MMSIRRRRDIRFVWRPTFPPCFSGQISNHERPKIACKSGAANTKRAGAEFIAERAGIRWTTSAVNHTMVLLSTCVTFLIYQIQKWLTRAILFYRCGVDFVPLAGVLSFMYPRIAFSFNLCNFLFHRLHAPIVCFFDSDTGCNWPHANPQQTSLVRRHTRLSWIHCRGRFYRLYSWAVFGL